MAHAPIQRKAGTSRRSVRFSIDMRTKQMVPIGRKMGQLGLVRIASLDDDGGRFSFINVRIAAKTSAPSEMMRRLNNCVTAQLADLSTHGDLLRFSH